MQTSVSVKTTSTFTQTLEITQTCHFKHLNNAFDYFIPFCICIFG